jgi:hypothetical protein
MLKTVSAKDLNVPSVSIYDSLIVRRWVANGGPSLLPPSEKSHSVCEAAKHVSLAGFASPFRLSRFL